MTGPRYSKTFHDVTFHFLVGKTAPESSIYTFYDEQAVRDALWNIRPGDIVFDIGVAFGSYALPAAAVGAIVYAFTPQSEYDDFLENIKVNDGFSDRIHPYKLGFYSKAGWINALTQKFYESEPEEMATNRDIFPVIRFDDAMANISPERIDWLKLDVEGAEVEVLKGAEQTLRKYRPKNLLVENHLFKNPSIAKEVNSFISSLGLGYKEVATMPYNAISHSLYAIGDS